MEVVIGDYCYFNFCLVVMNLIVFLFISCVIGDIFLLLLFGIGCNLDLVLVFVEEIDY